MTSDQVPGEAEILADARRLYGFLEVRGAVSRLHKDSWIPTLVYVLGPVTFEVEMDWRDEVTTLLVCRTVNGRRPPGYYMYEGLRMRIQLHQALSETGLLDAETLARIRVAGQVKGSLGMRAQLEACSQALQKNLEPLLANVHTLFGD